MIENGDHESAIIPDCETLRCKDCKEIDTVATTSTSSTQTVSDFPVLEEEQVRDDIELIVDIYLLLENTRWILHSLLW